MLINNFLIFFTPVTGSNFLKIAIRIVILSFIIEHETDSPRVHLIAESKTITYIHKLININIILTQSPF